MSLTPQQINERMGSRYPFPLRDTFVPTVFDDCISWEQQVLWLYRFTLGVYLELQDEGYLPIDNVEEGSDAVVTSDGIYQSLESLKSSIDADMSSMREDLEADMEYLQNAINNRMNSLNSRLQNLESLSTSVYYGHVLAANNPDVYVLDWTTFRSATNTGLMLFEPATGINVAVPHPILAHKSMCRRWKTTTMDGLTYFECDINEGEGPQIVQTNPPSDAPMTASSLPLIATIIWGSGSMPDGDWTPDGNAEVTVHLKFDGTQKRVTGFSFVLPDVLKDQTLPDFFGITKIS